MGTLKYLSLFSGIEAASLAFEPLGWEAVAFSEIDPFCCELLRVRFPSVPNLGDITAPDFIERARALDKPDLIVGGSPCQAFSVAGLRESMNDDRGNLTLDFVRVCRSLEPEWIVWENVPGVLSTRDNAFGCFLAALVGADAPLVSVLERGRWPDAGLVAGPERACAWRVLDAQFHGVPQRRRRVFVVSHPRIECCAAVLLESKSVRWDLEKGRETGESSTYNLAPSIGASGRGFARAGDSRGQDCVVPVFNNTGQGWWNEATVASGLRDMSAGGGSREATLVAGDTVRGIASHQAKGGDPTTDNYVVHSLRAEGFDASEDGTGRGTPLVPVAYIADDYEKYTFSECDQSRPLSTPADRTRAAPIVIQERAVSENPDAGPGGKDWSDEGVAYSLEARQRPQAVAFSSKDYGADAQADIAPTLRAMGHSESHANAGGQIAVAFHENQRAEVTTSDTAGSLKVGGGKPGQGYPAVAVQEAQTGVREYDTSGSLRANGPGHDPVGTRIREGMAIRRLTPTECLRLMGMPDFWTKIARNGKSAEQCADGPQYRAIGNSMVVNVMRWIGQRIEAVEKSKR